MPTNLSQYKQTKEDDYEYGYYDEEEEKREMASVAQKEPLTITRPKRPQKSPNKNYNINIGSVGAQF